MAVKDKRVWQGQQTRRRWYARLGAVRCPGIRHKSTEEIVSLAGVTKGARYDHFSDKETLFRRVLEQVQREVSDAAVMESLHPDPWHALVSGCRQWVGAHTEPAIRQIVMIDARGVLGWEVARSIETRFSTVALRGALRNAMQRGILTRRPLRPLLLMLTGALTEGVPLGRAENTAAARDEVTDLITGLLAGLRTTTEAGTSASRHQ